MSNKEKDKRVVQFNWAHIKEKNPKAFKMFIGPMLPEKHRDKINAFTVVKHNGVQYLELKVLSLRTPFPTTRILFDFFDSCRIFISCNYVEFTITQMDEEGAAIDHVKGSGFKNRVESESVAFTQAFELLETEITKKETDEPSAKIITL